MLLCIFVHLVNVFLKKQTKGKAFTFQLWRFAGVKYTIYLKFYSCSSFSFLLKFQQDLYLIIEYESYKELQFSSCLDLLLMTGKLPERGTKWTGWKNPPAGKWQSWEWKAGLATSNTTLPTQIHFTQTPTLHLTHLLLFRGHTHQTNPMREQFGNSQRSEKSDISQKKCLFAGLQSCG